jgi:transposase
VRRGSPSRRPTAGSGWPSCSRTPATSCTFAHPLRTKAIASARVKTDAVDARTLAHLLRADLLPEAYVAPRELRDLRDLLRQRVVLTQMRTALKNRVHALIARQGIAHGHAELFGSAGRATLERLPLRPQPRRRLEGAAATDR